MADVVLNQQNENDIRVMEGLEAVRVMPGMYVGGTDTRALHHLVYEVVDNSIDEIMAGRGDHVWTVIHNDGSLSVTDNCGGIPVGINRDKGISTLQLVMTYLHAGAKFNDGKDKVAYKISGGLHGVGVSAVNALSAQLIAEVRRDGKLWRQVYEAGKPVTEVEFIRNMEAGEPTGTTIRFYPDMTIMQTGDFQFATLVQRFREMAYVTRGATLTLIDERDQPFPNEMTFYVEGGVKSFVRYLNRNRDVIHEVISGIKDVKFNEGTPNEGLMTVEFGFQYTDGTSSSTELSFANHINTPDGGSHQTGLRMALTRVINLYARKQGLLKDKDTNFSGRDTLEGLTAIVSIKHPAPQFESQTKGKLINPEVQSAVASVVSDVFAEYLEINPREARRIVDKCMNSMRIRDALDKQRELLTGRKNLLENTTLPGKLADCSDRDPSKTELYLVEGDSAGGCLGPDTEVALVDGRSVSFKTLVEEQNAGKEHFCYTVRNDGTVGVERILNARITKKNATVIRVKLDNDEEIICTPDHPFMLRDGSYKPASALTSDDSLMPLYRKLSDERVASTRIERLKERIDVYDIEVPNTHNFALASGVFVHNSAKQGRDRHFQAILPLRGKILNTERARLNKILDSTEIRALISALGVGISDDFNLAKLRYNRVIIMSVAGDEPTLVMDRQGNVELVKIGEFIDACAEGRKNHADYQVMAFDLKTHQTGFRPLKAAIRHHNSEPMFNITTRYNRSVKVTAGHSVFVLNEGQLQLKKGNEIRLGDTVVASRRLPRPTTHPTQVDLLTTFYAAGVTDNLYLEGEDIRCIGAQRSLAKVERPDLLAEPRVILTDERWQQLSAHRQANGLSQMAVAEQIGVKQPITISHWERSINRPILPQFLSYVREIKWEGALDYVLLPAKIDERITQDDTSKNARWRKIGYSLPFDSFTSAEVEQLGDAIKIAPHAHREKAFARHLPVTRELMWFLGWYTAEGTMSAHQISLNIGKKDEPFIPELIATIETVFGETARTYYDPDSDGIKLYFHSVLAARLLKAWGLSGKAHEKQLPDIVFNVPEALQIAFLEAYFLGDGTCAAGHITMVTNSPTLKDGLLYLLGQLGLLATHTQMHPKIDATLAIQTKHDYFPISICGKDQLEASAGIWQRHPKAARLQAYATSPNRKALAFTPISDDLIGLPVLSIEQIAPTSEYVYDFSVQTDENFICGTGGLCAHNTDADVDGAHIRTLLLTFFFRYMQPLIQDGHLFIAQPPIFRLEYKKQIKYYYPEAGVKEDALLVAALSNYSDPQKVAVSRYKGLGEMNPQQLWETTMDPAHRTLLRVTIDDATEADRIFDMLMGTQVPPRRRFITTHAQDAKLDV